MTPPNQKGIFPTKCRENTRPIYGLSLCHIPISPYLCIRNQEIDALKFLKELNNKISNHLNYMSYEEDDFDPYDGPYNDNRS